MSEEAKKRAIEYLEGNIYNDIPTCFTDTQKVAIADFMYNAGKYSKHTVTGTTFLTYVKRCDLGTIKQFIYPGNYRSKGLKKRRNAERLYLIN